MVRQWTKAQKSAIESRDGTVLVSAAAGSGKTAVLVQRIIDRITDKKKPGSVERLLVVTFTRAAAGEMRMRIGKSLNEELASDPHNSHIKRQLMLLQTAKINTIDSFCSNLVRDNFHVLGISPDYLICSETRRALLRRRAVDEAIEEMYRSEDFALLCDTLTKDKDDSVIADAIYELHDFLMANPFPERWAEDCINNLQSDDGLEAYRQIIKNAAAEIADDCAMMCGRALRLAQSDETVAAAYEAHLADEKASLQQIAKNMRSDNWDSLCRFEYKFGTMPRLKNSADYQFIKDTVNNLRKKYKEQLSKAFKLFSADSEKIREQSNQMVQPVKLLLDATLLFDKKFSALKSAGNMFDFSDLLHLTLKLLVSENEDGSFSRTPLAQELSEQYDEILIDEYQDTNLAQNAIFDALSKNGENMFMVGDVKQSIYRFRQAVPEIFMQKLSSLPAFDGNYPAKILLDSNFRSRNEITDAVNFLFGRIMSKDFGQIDYSDGHALNAAAQYPQSTGKCVETLLIDCSDSENKGAAEYDKYEAAAIGRKIKSMIEQKIPVKDGENERPCSYGDFCILLQTRKNKAHHYFETLSNMGVPVWTQGTDSLFEQSEIQEFLSMLRIFDNPMQDIDLLCALHSPVFGFDDNDICSIRLNNEETGLYAAIKQLSEQNAKCADFIDVCERYRRLSYTMPTDRLISTFFDEMSYPEIMAAVYDDRLVKNNLQLLLQTASEFENQGCKGLCAFLRYIDGMNGIKGGDINSANGISNGADVVRIMTIHKSKGLEFPICFISDNDRGFSRKDGKSKLLYHQKYGCATVLRDEQSLEEIRPTIWEALRLKINDDQLSESLRLLYVAMTRAKERLIFTITSDNIGKLCEKSLSMSDDKGEISGYRLRSAACFSEWILSCALMQDSARPILEKYDIDPTLIKKLPQNSCIDWSFELAAAEESSDSEQAQFQTPPSDPELVERIKKCAAAKYPYEMLCTLPSKLSVSEISHNSQTETLCAVKRPRFAENRSDAASRGTILHKIMQCIDFSHDIDDVGSFAQRLVELEIFTPSEMESVELGGIAKFIKSELYKKIACADRILREYPFSINIPISQLDGMPKNTDEKAVLEGIVDLIYIKNGKAYIVDYKSDRCFDRAEFISRYRKQLELYADAVKRTLALPVAGCSIYSIAMAAEIEIV